jgi:hypothetical protein
MESVADAIDRDPTLAENLAGDQVETRSGESG